VSDSASHGKSDGSDDRPNPDPTRLTLAAVRREILSLRELIEAKLEGHVETADTRMRGLDASMTKSDADRARQLEALHTLIQTLTTGLETRISDVKERLTKLEATGLGRESAHERRQTSSRDTVSTIGMVAGALIGVVGVAAALWNHGSPATATPPVTIVNSPPAAASAAPNPSITSTTRSTAP
jgi:hypothetical protein